MGHYVADGGFVKAAFTGDQEDHLSVPVAMKIDTRYKKWAFFCGLEHDEFVNAARCRNFSSRRATDPEPPSLNDQGATREPSQKSRNAPFEKSS